jgi:hypothetical protein
MKSPAARFRQAYLLNWHYSAANLNMLGEKRGNTLKRPKVRRREGNRPDRGLFRN